MGNAESTPFPAIGHEFSAEALATGKYSDLTIQCKGLVLKVHRLVVCSASKPFAAMVDGNFLEATTGIINLPDDEPDIVAKMIQFLYTSSYDDTEYTQIQTPAPGAYPAAQKCDSPDKLVKDKDQDLVTHAKVYIIADKYDIPTLKQAASLQYEAIARVFWMSPFFIESISLLCENTTASDRVLKDFVIEIAYEHRAALLTVDGFKELLVDYGEVGIDMLVCSTQPPSKKAKEGARFSLFCPNQSCWNGEAYSCRKCHWSTQFFKECPKNTSLPKLLCANSSCRDTFHSEDVSCRSCHTLLVEAPAKSV